MAQGALGDGYPTCGDHEWLDDQFCAPSTQLEYFRAEHVFYALDAPLPAETLATVTIIPEPGVDVNLYGGPQGTTSFSVPPNFQVANCEASLTPKLPMDMGPLFTNPGEAESFLVFTGNNPKNLFFAVSAPPGEDGDVGRAGGGFTVQVDTIDLRTDLCEADDYEQVRGLERWPNSVETIEIVDGHARIQGTTEGGIPPLCSLDWAASSQNACFPITERTHFDGNVRFYAIEEPPPAGSHVRVTLNPAPGVDVNLMGYHLGLDDYTVPPLVPAVGVCEASYPLNLDDGPEPGVPDSIEFQSIRNPYRYFIMVAARADNELGGEYTLEVEVTEPPPPHCPESLPGANFPAWPAAVSQIELDDEGHGEAAGDLADGSCVNHGFANTSQVACFPATRNHMYEGNHVFYALSEPIPPRSVVTITAAPTDGGEISLYGLQAGENNFPVPPKVHTGICEASYGPGVGGPPNPGEPETIRFFNPSDNFSYNIFFAVAGDAMTGEQGTFDVEVDLEVGVVHCEESLPGEAYEAWPDAVQQVQLDEDGEWTGQGDLMTGACTNLDFASDAQVACWPATQNEHYQGNHVYYALAEPMPPRSVLTLTATPLDPELDISFYGVQQGTDSYQVPPRVLGGICETDNGHPAGNPGEPEAIRFFNPSDRAEYNIFFGVAGADGVTEGQFEVSASLDVGELHCEESLPGRPYDRWPVTVRRVSLDGNGEATVEGNLNTGACVNLGWASSSQTACFPAVLDDGYQGNHVFFALDEPLPPETSLFIRANPEVNVYGYTVGVDNFSVPPYVPTTVSCEYNADPGAEIRLNTVRNPYNVFIGVAGPAGVVDGDFTLELRTEAGR